MQTHTPTLSRTPTQAHPAPAADVRRGGSVPGVVRQVPGGVGRNIAEAAAHLMALDAAGAAGASASGRRSASTAAASSSDSTAAMQQQQQRRRPNSGVMLITVLGRDAAGDALARHCAALGFPAAGLVRAGDSEGTYNSSGGSTDSSGSGGTDSSGASAARTATVSIVFDRGGEVAASVADVGVVEAHLTPALVARFEADVARARLVVIDGNLSEAAAAAAARAAAAGGAPVLFEPISAPKAARCAGLLSDLAYITPNGEELLAIAAEVRRRQRRMQSGQQQQSVQQHEQQQHGGQQQQQQGSSLPAETSAARALARLAPAAAEVLAAGAGCILLTLGAHGAALLELEGGSSSGRGAGSSTRRTVVARHIPAAPAAVRSVSGAGDCLAAGFAAALARGAPPEVALAEGTLAAKAAVESAANVPARGALASSARDPAAVRRQLAALHVLRFPAAGGAL